MEVRLVARQTELGDDGRANVGEIKDLVGARFDRERVGVERVDILGAAPDLGDWFQVLAGADGFVSVDPSRVFEQFVVFADRNSASFHSLVEADKNPGGGEDAAGGGDQGDQEEVDALPTAELADLLQDVIVVQSHGGVLT